MLSRNVAHMSRLVNDLLDVSRITRGLINIELEPVDLNAILRECAETIDPLVQAKHLTVELRLAERPPLVSGDRIRLTQVFCNLLNNAAKYTPESGHIEVTVTLDGAMIQVDVKDNGMGLPPELLPKIFDLFTQGERTLARSEGGLGIGLTLVKRLVELHGGTIEAVSEGVDHGTSFCVRLPLGAATSVSTPAHEPSAPTPAAPGALRILIIDDNPDVADGLTMFFELQHATVKIALNGPQGLIEAEQFSPHIVILDIGLPNMNGFEVARRLRTLPSAQHIVLIALSGYAPNKDDPRALAANFDHYLIKPPNLAQLKELIDQYNNIH
jgi:CheY-like chemotaxis protein/two-component sensor histidine kinase